MIDDRCRLAQCVGGVLVLLVSSTTVIAQEKPTQHSVAPSHSARSVFGSDWGTPEEPGPKQLAYKKIVHDADVLSVAAGVPRCPPINECDPLVWEVPSGDDAAAGMVIAGTRIVAYSRRLLCPIDIGALPYYPSFWTSWVNVVVHESQHFKQRRYETPDVLEDPNTNPLGDLQNRFLLLVACAHGSLNEVDAVAAAMATGVAAANSNGANAPPGSELLYRHQAYSSMLSQFRYGNTNMFRAARYTSEASTLLAQILAGGSSGSGTAGWPGNGLANAALEMLQARLDQGFATLSSALADSNAALGN